MRRRSSSAAARAAALFTLALGLAAAARGGPLVELLQAREQRLDALLAAGGEQLSEAGRAEAGKVLTELIDFAAMGETALGAEWGKRSEAERQAYLEAFTDLVRANALRRLDLYRGRTIQYLSESETGDEGSVLSNVLTKDATTEISYTFRRQEGSWRIVDYAVDGISTARNYRAQFGKVLRKDGFEALLERLRKRQGEIEAAP
jgi:phospholipid transport system substrate-binding protein